MPLLLCVAVVVVAVALSGGLGIGPGGSPGGSAGSSGSGAGSPGSDGSPGTDPTAAPLPTPVPPLGGTELLGYLPYWQMTDAMATYLRSTPLTTLALFSVSARQSGAIDTRPTGYRRITGDIGRRLIDEARGRGSRVELVFTSFGADRNGVLFGRLPPTRPAASNAAPSPGLGPTPTAIAPSLAPTPAVAPWHRTVDELVSLAVDLGVDGINVDVELLEADDRAAYGEFLAALRAALIAANPEARLSVATEAGPRGIANAAEAIAVGADRVFLMGYDYHWSGSPPGASAPIDRSDGLYTLRWSIDRYVEAGVPRDRILLGLPLYGMTWRATGPDRSSPLVGEGVAFIPNLHLDVLLDPAFKPGRNPLELAEFFSVPDGLEWLVTYYDSPGTLRPKLALARDNGLAGAGFWAIGYERGLPGFVELMTAFRDGEVAREESPPR